jgi:hypothetical protein
MSLWSWAVLETMDVVVTAAVVHRRDDGDDVQNIALVSRLICLLVSVITSGTNDGFVIVTASLLAPDRILL